MAIIKTSRKAERIQESVIREMTRVTAQYSALNLGQGFPDFDTPSRVVDAAVEALKSGANQYSITWGSKNLRDAISRYYQHWYSLDYHPEREITVCCGSTEAMLSTVLGTLDPEDEIIIFEPYYENYWPDSILCGATARFVPLSLGQQGWELDKALLKDAFSSKTGAIIVNTPNNPTGMVFSREELLYISQLCQEHNVLLISDEIYNHIIYDGNEHIPPATLPGMKERTVTINALSKTFSVTGWRVGWACAPAAITSAIRKIHDFATVGAPHPFQEAGAKALAFEDDYFNQLGPFYQQRRDLLLDILRECGFKPVCPKGAYYIMADISQFGIKDDVEFSLWMAKEIGVSVVPGSSFFINNDDGKNWVRFCFSKTFETLKAAHEKLKRLKGYVSQL